MGQKAAGLNNKMAGLPKEKKPFGKLGFFVTSERRRRDIYRKQRVFVVGSDSRIAQ